MSARLLTFAAAFALLSSLLSAEPKEESKKMRLATFAGGCFWCMQPPYDALKGKGVVKTIVGYTGGDKKDPAYEEVSSGGTGHAEAIQIIYDPDKIDYAALLDIFWHNIDPTDKGGQFCDRGSQYRSAIFYHDDEQKELAVESKEALLKSGVVPEVHTEITKADTFYPAEEYHQDYYEKHAWKYKFYRYSCGRDERLEEIWKKS